MGLDLGGVKIPKSPDVVKIPESSRNFAKFREICLEISENFGNFEKFRKIQIISNYAHSPPNPC